MKKIFVCTLFLVLITIVGCSQNTSNENNELEKVVVEDVPVVKEIDEEAVLDSFVSQDYDVVYSTEQEGYLALINLSKDCYSTENSSVAFKGSYDAEIAALEKAYYRKLGDIIEQFEFETSMEKQEIIKVLQNDDSNFFVKAMAYIADFMNKEHSVQAEMSKEEQVKVYQTFCYYYEALESNEEFAQFFIEMINKAYPNYLEIALPIVLKYGETSLSGSGYIKNCERVVNLLELGNMKEQYAGIIDSRYIAMGEKKEEEPKEVENKPDDGKDEPYIGMSKFDVEYNCSWGKPSDKNITETVYGVSEQWVYPGYGYIYIDDGYVTAIQR